MEVTCTNCKTKLNIPDEKIPKDQIVRISCPKCKNKITIEPPKIPQKENTSDDSFAETGKMHLKFIEPSGKVSGGEGAAGYDDYADDTILDFFEKDTKLALVLSGEDIDTGKMKTSLEGLGYRFVPSPDTRDALGKLRFHHFDMIILSESFDGQPLENSPIMNFLNHMSMPSRRRIFLVLLSDRFKSSDDSMAYAMSANMVINTKDLDKLQPLLKRGLSEHEKFYKIFMDMLVETGKA